MRRSFTTLLLLLSLAAPATAADGPVADPVDGPTWYLSLGDSLAAGYQAVGDPERDHITRAGYADQLWLMARQAYPDLRLRNLACPGTSTASIREASTRCAYEHDSQLAEALAFIAGHEGEVAFVTIDLGFADFACDDISCLWPGLTAISQRLPGILEELRSAAPGVPIVGMNVYDPFLSLWFDEETRALSEASVDIVGLIDKTLGLAYASAGVPVADVATAFEIGDWEPSVAMAGRGDVPRNVALLCERTFLCDAPPLGPDRHPNVLGARVIAEVFARELGLEPVGVDLGPRESGQDG